MTQKTLPDERTQIFIDDALVPAWDRSDAVGFDVNAAKGTEAFIPIGESLDDVGEVYPHLTVMRSNETAPGETGYNFLAPNGGGQDRNGQLVVTARAEYREDGYTGDSATYSAVDADTLVNTLIDEVENTVLENQFPQDTRFDRPLGSYRGADAPDDFDATPTVRIEQCIVLYSWSRLP